jgi:hypothetical protein
VKDESWRTFVSGMLIAYAERLQKPLTDHDRVSMTQGINTALGMLDGSSKVRVYCCTACLPAEHADYKCYFTWDSSLDKMDMGQYIDKCPFDMPGFKPEWKEVRFDGETEAERQVREYQANMLKLTIENIDGNNRIEDDDGFVLAYQNRDDALHDYEMLVTAWKDNDEPVGKISYGSSEPRTDVHYMLLPHMIAIVLKKGIPFYKLDEWMMDFEFNCDEMYAGAERMAEFERLTAFKKRRLKPGKD